MELSPPIKQELIAEIFNDYFVNIGPTSAVIQTSLKD